MHLNGNPVYTGYHNIWKNELPGWLYLQSVLYLYWGQTQVKVWNSASTCEPAARSQWDWKVSVGSFVSLPAGLDPGSHLNWDYWALNVSQITAAFHVWVHCAAPSARPSQQTLTSGLPVQVRGFSGQTPDFNLSDIVFEAASTCSRRTISESQGPPWLDLDCALFIWTILTCVEVLEPGVKRGRSTELLANAS